MRDPTLVASSWTLAGNYPFPPPAGSCSPVDFRDRVVAAVRAGYRGIGLGFWDLSTPKARYGYEGMRAIFDDHGLEVMELETFINWFGPPDPAADAINAELLEAASALRPRHMKTVGNLDGTFWPMADMRERFALLARQVEDLGARLGIEILPNSNIATLETARDVMGDAYGRAAGLTLDIWHVTRGGIDYAKVRALKAAHIVSVELDDADERVVGTLLEDMTLRRRLCGEGSFDVPAFIEAVLATGYDGPFGVEIVSDEQRRRPLTEAAQRSYQTALRQFGSRSRPKSVTDNL